jgi:hypothetical protein
MKVFKKTIVITGLATLAVIGVAAITPPKPARGAYTNLQVLPADISPRQLNKIMVDEFEDGLGVSCTFCHAENNDTHKPDYASDEKPEKEIARAMIRMTLEINSRYFELNHPMIGDSVIAVTCSTCHNGQPRPGNDSTR